MKQIKIISGAEKALCRCSVFFAALITLFSAGCSIHEFPDDWRTQTIPVQLSLNFSSEWPLHKEINVPLRASEAGDEPYIRYIVKVFTDTHLQADNPKADTTLVFTKPASQGLNEVRMAELLPGDYTLYVWADYVQDSSATHYFYNASDFKEITVADIQHYSGNTVLSDAFCGTTQIAVNREQIGAQADAGQAHYIEASVSMKRPLAKFTFISTDYAEFVGKLLEEKEQSKSNAEPQEARALNLQEYSVVFRYTGFKPIAFNFFTNKPSDALTGIAFRSSLQALSQTEVQLGFDYVLINGSETSVPVAVEVYDGAGTLIAGVPAVEVPLLRGRHTIVRGPFLSTKASGGVGINPEFDGEYNIAIE